MFVKPQNYPRFHIANAIRLFVGYFAIFIPLSVCGISVRMLGAIVLSAAPIGLAVAAETPKVPVPASESQALDTKIQSLKREALELNRDLGVLEEELLSPAQVVMFLSLDAEAKLALQAVDLKLDGAVIARHRYTDRERHALTRGGAQRLYIGNLETGTHQLIAVFTGKGAGNRDYRRGTTVTFEKAEAALKRIELQIVAGSGNQPAVLRVKEW